MIHFLTHLTLLALILLASCASETPADRSVTLIEKNVPKSCKLVGVVSAENLVRDRAITGLKQMTLDLKGNFVKITDEKEKGVMTVLKGDAYLCD